ncbi:IS5 family transposase [Paraneptunicella aestuarii]|uniref:IS5 family transposase n=1 Tax=Paraneptunicella aestuarii TaxID=2831148 RepID=UPI001E2C97D2|nr:IS5 family transposase [Paraneptunicella aestuarii]UAA37196.1 IS5 family transposase [Paraneptunicella aestuarii]
MPRTMLTDNAWKKLKNVLKESGRVYNKYEHRNTLEGILYRMRTGIQWRDLPPEFGLWNTIFRRFNLWSKKGVLEKLLSTLAKESDTEWLFIDGSIVKAHQDSARSGRKDEEAIGKSRGGNSTKIHLAVDSGGLPVYFELSGGQVNDIVHAESLISHASTAQHVVADKGYDSEVLRDFIENKGSQSQIPRKQNSRIGNSQMEWCLYRYRHLVENAFMKIKKYRAVATRYDKLARNYRSIVALAFVMMWLPMYCD